MRRRITASNHHHSLSDSHSEDLSQMASRARPVKRTEKPLSPSISVLTVVDDSLVELLPEQVTPRSVGLKAYGLASIPPAWTRPFFVIPHESHPSVAALIKAIETLGFPSDKKLMVRSSGENESMDNRGALESAECSASELIAQVEALRQKFTKSDPLSHARVHWLVQPLLTTIAKGHLSNERRIAEDKRDWVAEVEASANHPVEAKPISLRTWRDNRPAHEGLLSCLYKEQYTQCLTTVAKWTYERLIRVHFEWVWDGHAVYIVQADSCDDVAGGVDPKQLVQRLPKSISDFTLLKAFREATDDDYKQYRKLANASQYKKLGYSMPPFYVLDDLEEIRRIIEDGNCSEAVRSDLQVLVSRPLVIRTDGCNIPAELRQMLPRSEELRSTDEAEHWLLNSFRQKASKSVADSGAPLIHSKPCLIAHHFVPATASAWCQARPDQRRVRIESLWGLPEGLYWYAYDAYDVDTQVSHLTQEMAQPSIPRPLERRRYKERFVAPDEQGRWVLHKTAAGFDWQRSIKRTEWIHEIAWTSRKIANAVGHPVVVMWFVDVHKSVSTHRVLPWYHEEWKAGSSPHKVAPRRKFTSASDFELRAKLDWELLKSKVARGEQIVRIKVQPDEPDLVRDREFAKQLAVFTNKNKIVVELEGGILSHAYYMLSREGCTVECSDLDDYATEAYELEFNKLVRDKIPSSIAAKGEAVIVLRLAGEALIAALRRKLVEESLEVLDARTVEEMAEELADLREVVLSLMSRLEITEAEIEARRKNKAAARGIFDAALMLTKTTVASPMGFREMQVNDDADQILVSSTINQEAAIPSALEDTHVDRRVDEMGIEERQFTIDVPAHASGYRPSRVLFRMPTKTGEQHDMVFELLLARRGPDLRVRVRLLNADVQLSLDLKENMPAVPTVEGHP